MIERLVLNKIVLTIGRRGGRSGQITSRQPEVQSFSVTQEYSQRSVQRETVKPKHERFPVRPAANITPSSNGYKTQLGNQSLI